MSSRKSDEAVRLVQVMEFTKKAGTLAKELCDECAAHRPQLEDREGFRGTEKAFEAEAAAILKEILASGVVRAGR